MNERPCPLRHTQQGLPKPLKRRSLSFETVNLGLDSRRQHGVGSVPTKLSKLVFEMLLGLRGNIPDPVLTLDSGKAIMGKTRQS